MEIQRSWSSRVVSRPRKPSCAGAIDTNSSLGDGPSATNNLDGPEHLYGGYLVRMGETFAYGVGAGKEYDPITGKVLPGITLFSF